MGLVGGEVMFDGRAPTATRIAGKVTELVGLPVHLNADRPTGADDLYDLHATLAFARYPDTKLELIAYRRGAVMAHMARTGMDDAAFTRAMQGANEPPGTQTVYFRGYVGHEPTLFVATTIALGALGGRTREPVTPEERRDYGGQITDAELDRRHRRARREGMLALSAGVALLPVLVPLWLASGIWLVLTLPQRVRRVYKAYSGAQPAHPAGRPPARPRHRAAERGPS